jgi:hypothetical protein
MPLLHTISIGFLVSSPVTSSGSGASPAAALRWDARVHPSIEVGLGVEQGYSTGDESIQRFALLPGAAFVYPLGRLHLRVEDQIGWQIVRGHVTLDAIPLRGTETRGLRNELCGAVDLPVTDALDLRVRAGLTIDGLYPEYHSSTHAGVLVGVLAVARL